MGGSGNIPSPIFEAITELLRYQYLVCSSIVNGSNGFCEGWEEDVHLHSHGPAPVFSEIFVSVVTKKVSHFLTMPLSMNVQCAKRRWVIGTYL